MHVSSQQIERPYIDFYGVELGGLAREYWDDPYVLSDILDELLFRRRRIAVNLRGRIVERLRELQEQSFSWPSTDARVDSGKLGEVDWPKEGLLSFMGYRVGQKGAVEESRRAILDYIYARDVPNVTSVDYMLKWGKPNTGKRLLKLARSIGNFVKNAKRKDVIAYMVSIIEWESDLDYLKRKYYTGRYDFGRDRFKWPLTDV